MDGKSIPVDDVERSSIYPLRLFGWSEIETLGRDPKRQLDLLDKLIEDLIAIKEEKKQLRLSLSENRQQISQVIAKLTGIANRNDKEIRKYLEYKREFDELNTPEVQQLFEELDKNRDYLKYTAKLIRTIEMIGSQISDVKISELYEIFKDGETSEDLREWWLKVSTQISVEEGTKQVKSNLNLATSGLGTLKERATSLKENIENDIRTIEGEIRSKVSTDPSKLVLTDLRSQAKERLERIERLKDEYEEVYEELNGLLNERNCYLIQLLQYHRKISKLRQNEKNVIENRLNEFQTADMRISLEFRKDGNRSELKEFLSNFSCLQSAHRNFRSRKWPELIAEKHTPLDLSHAILRQRSRSLVYEFMIDGKNYQIDPDEADNIIGYAFPYGFDELAEINIVDWPKLESLLNLQEIDWDDQERILRNDQPVDTSSPGQRSSAMLPLIALAESVPLIIDQPEDNLDNRLVGKVLVEILAKLKEKRQIIVSTHNPNIVVLGDAEQVVVLDAINDRRGCVENQASIDDPNVIQSVIELMEGGKDAFDTRNKRYQVR